MSERVSVDDGDDERDGRNGRDGRDGRDERSPVSVLEQGDQTNEEELAALGRLSYYLDDRFVVPGTTYRVGLDPLLGLLPGVGDVATSTASAYIVARAAALGVPRETLVRMLLILVVDAVVGSVPLVGDVFDAVWKANTRNVRLAEARLDSPEDAVIDRRFVIVVTVALTLSLLLVGLGTFLAGWWLLTRSGLV